ncbi:MAG: protein translocase subunit SecD, partial [Phycisphaerales bacterium]
MRHLYRHIVLVLALTLIAIASIWPPQTKLKGAKDIQGGTSLVYQVNVSSTDRSDIDIMETVVDLLKRRLDPDGIMDIQIEVQSGNRIEITMPLPGADAKAARADFEAKLKALSAATISVDQLERTMASADRTAELALLSGGDAARSKLLADAAAAYDRSIVQRREFAAAMVPLQTAVEQAGSLLDQAQKAQAPKEEIDRLTAAQVEAQGRLDNAAAAPAVAMSEYVTARDLALQSSVSEAEVRRALALPDNARKYVDDLKVEQSIESPRTRAINRLKATHASAAKQIDEVANAWKSFRTSRRTLDDAEDLKRLMRASGTLTFRIAPKAGAVTEESRLRQELQQRGPRNVRSDTYRWFKLNKLESWYGSNEELKLLDENPAAFFANSGKYIVERYDNEHYMLCYDTPWRGNDKKRLTSAEGEWKLRGSQPIPDEFGKPAIAFSMDTLGADRMGQLTSANRGSAMAVLLDDEVVTAPSIQSRITSEGRITGSFTLTEVNYIVRVLNAGSLAAKISPDPISDNTVGPELGRDNLDRGLRAGVISFVVVAGFMIVYYFAGGVFAVLALVLNGLFILAVMSIKEAAFSLPGIAGVILTFGMAVDANVLIYERMREEMQQNAADLRTAVRLGYQRALSSIIDGNLTNLIVCVVLMFFGTQEIRGFAITMTIGTLTTLFCQLYVTRLLFTFFVDKMKWRKMSMLPMAIPALQRALSPTIDWMKYRWHFATVSLVLTVASLLAISYRGTALLDTEFLSGTKVTVTFKKGDQPILAKRAEVEESLEAFAAGRAAKLRASEAALRTETNDDKKAELARAIAQARLESELAQAEIITVNPQADGVTSSTFVIKSSIQNRDVVQAAVAEVFADKLPQLPKLPFAGSEIRPEGPNDPKLRNVPARPIVTARLAEVLDAPNLTATAQEFVGGVAIGPINFEPPQGVPMPSLSSLIDRLEIAKRRPQFTTSVPRKHRFVILDGTAEAVKSVALLVHDDQISYLTDEAQWTAEVKFNEWNLAVDALTTSTTGSSGESF